MVSESASTLVRTINASLTFSDKDQEILDASVSLLGGFSLHSSIEDYTKHTCASTIIARTLPISLLHANYLHSLYIDYSTVETP